MDYKAITDTLMQTGQELAQKGQAMAEQKLQIPEAGPEREAMLNNLGKGAAAGGLLVALLGTGIGRKLTGTTLKLGSLAALGTVAYQAFQKWQGQGAEVGAPAAELAGPDAEKRSLALLKAMIAAAKADGHIDEAERASIGKQLESLALDPDSIEFFRAEIAKPLSAVDVAAGADTPAAAAEIYLTTLLVIDEQNDQERGYLRELAEALKLAPELVAELEAHAKA